MKLLKLRIPAGVATPHPALYLHLTTLGIVMYMYIYACICCTWHDVPMHHVPDTRDRAPKLAVL